MQAKKPDPRFNQFIQQFDSQGIAIGFKIPNNDFLFQYDQFGGWRDQKGKYFNKDGIYQSDDEGAQDRRSKSDEQQENQSDIDDQIVDQFQQMLIEEQQGIIRKKNTNKQNKNINKDKQSDFNIDEQTKKYIQKLKNQSEIRQGLTKQIFIYFKMKSNQYERIKPKAQKIQAIDQRNKLIKQIKVSIEQTKKKLIQSNKSWLQGEFLLQNSGSSLEQGIYDRYWHGWVKVSHEKYFQTVYMLKSSKQFALLKSKTFYALASKFYLKNKMKQTINDLITQIKDVKQNQAVSLQFNNLPEDFPLSLILDFVEYSGGFIEDIEDIDILDKYSCGVIVKKRTAQKLMNIEGYRHDQKEYVWLQVKLINSQMKFNKLFNVQVDAEFKLPLAQICDTLGLQSSRDQIAKFGEKQSPFRLVVNQNVLKKILMFRGQTLNIIRVVRFQNKE